MHTRTNAYTHTRTHTHTHIHAHTHTRTVALGVSGEIKPSLAEAPLPIGPNRLGPISLSRRKRAGFVGNCGKRCCARPRSMPLSVHTWARNSECPCVGGQCQLQRAAGRAATRLRAPRSLTWAAGRRACVGTRGGARGTPCTARPRRSHGSGTYHARVVVPALCLAEVVRSSRNNTGTTLEPRLEPPEHVVLDAPCGPPLARQVLHFIASHAHAALLARRGRVHKVSGVP